MTLVLFIFVNLVFFCPKMILSIKIEISRNDFYNSLGFYFYDLKLCVHNSGIEYEVIQIHNFDIGKLNPDFKHR